MTASSTRIRVLIAKTSVDGHLRGVATVCQHLKDAGMEVIYGGQLTSAQIFETALQEDVDVIGLNIGGRIGHVADLMKMLEASELGDALVVAGGPILDEDIPELEKMGIAKVFPTGARIEDIVSYVGERAPHGRHETDRDD